MAVRDILLLGDPGLYQPSREVLEHEAEAMQPVIEDLFDTMLDFQARHGWGRAIAAPQIGVHKRIVCMFVDTPIAFLNPVLDQHSDEMMTHWEDCMSFPELLVQLRNPRSCRLRCRDVLWGERQYQLAGDYAELLQHEVDHLDGVLAVQRALDDKSIALRRARPAKVLALQGSFAEITTGTSG